MLKDKSKKPSSKTQSTKVEKLPTLTIAELNAIAGGKGVITEKGVIND